ncbi:hypothetical protein P153DRAFT_416501, partial [Dothidotthia symphoricarpi CBS 119687]
QTRSRQIDRIFARTRSPVVTPLSRDLHVPGPSLQHRRVSSMSSMASMPSLPGLGHFRNDLESDVSGLGSLLPASPRPWCRAQELETERSWRPFVMPGDKLSMEYKDIPNQMDKIFGHHRKYTDLFVDHVSHQTSTNSRPRVALRRSVSLPCLSAVRTPTSATFQPLRDSAVSADLPIHPSPLRSAPGKLFHTPEAHARLDARKPDRANWIQTQAKVIVSLGRRVAAALQAYQQSGKQEDYDAWQNAQEAFSDATDPVKR